jgi:hypothetical protein
MWKKPEPRARRSSVSSYKALLSVNVSHALLNPRERRACVFAQIRECFTHSQTPAFGSRRGSVGAGLTLGSDSEANTFSVATTICVIADHPARSACLLDRVGR